MGMQFDKDTIARLKIRDIKKCCERWEKSIYDCYSMEKIQNGEALAYVNEKIKEYADIMVMIQRKELASKKIHNKKEREERLLKLSELICSIELQFQNIGVFVLAGETLYGKSGYYDYLQKNYGFNGDHERMNNDLQNEGEKLKYIEACFRNYNEGKFRKEDVIYALRPYFLSLSIYEKTADGNIFETAAREAFLECDTKNESIYLFGTEQLLCNDTTGYRVINRNKIYAIADEKELSEYLKKSSGGKLFDQGYGLTNLIAKNMSREKGFLAVCENTLIYMKALQSINENGILQDTKNRFIENECKNHIPLQVLEEIWTSSVQAYMVFKDQYWDTKFESIGKISEVMTDTIMDTVHQTGQIQLHGGDQQVYVFTANYAEQTKDRNDTNAYTGSPYWVFETGDYDDGVMIPLANETQVKGYIEQSLIGDVVIEPVKYNGIANSILEEVLKNKTKLEKDYDLTDDGTIWKSKYRNPKGDMIYTLQRSKAVDDTHYHTDVWHFREDFSVKDAWLFLAKQDYIEKVALYQRVDAIMR
jgi:hypothetical protein